MCWKGERKRDGKEGKVMSYNILPSLTLAVLLPYFCCSLKSKNRNSKMNNDPDLLRHVLVYCIVPPQEPVQWLVYDKANF